jgi:rsbT co-antagonist protein RsbR
MASLPPEDPRSAQLRDLILQLLPSTARASLPLPAAADLLDQAIAGFAILAEELVAHRAAAADAEQHLNEQLEMIVGLVSFNYEKRVPVGDAGTLFDAFGAGLNMLAEELAASTVSKEHVNNIIESMSDMLVVVDRDALIRTVNQSACDLLGRPREELLSRPFEPLFEGLSTADLIAKGGVRDQERALRIGGGASMPVSFSAAVMRDKHGAPEGLVCVARDLTGAKLSEEERWRLREAVQRQAVTLEELSTPLIPITNEVLVMPLIGTVDEQRSAQIIDTLLQGVISRRARVVLIDITGIKTMDAPGVDGILKAVKAVNLVGAEVMLTGIRPEVARLLVAQSHDLGAIKTFGSLHHGIAHAMKRARRAAPG